MKKGGLTHTEAAQRRARISAYLSNNPGPHKTEEVAKQLEITVRSAGQLLRGMANGGLIPPYVGTGSNKTWQWATQEGPPPAPKPSAPAKEVAASKAHPPNEVELEVFGIAIIVGRNPKTGRLRITLEG